MRKETIIKYEKEFLAWCKGESVLLGAPTSMHDRTLIWREVRDFNDWKPLDTVYVLNDSYYIYRKALAEGKIIQLNEAEKFSDQNRGWVDLSCTSLGSSTNLFPVEYYRIKPEEPKFKVGEWYWVGYKLMKFNKLIKEEYNTTFEFISPNRDVDGYKIKEHILERHLQIVEPFIGQLPSYLKE